jgi:hypothetical protein
MLSPKGTSTWCGRGIGAASAEATASNKDNVIAVKARI